MNSEDILDSLKELYRRYIGTEITMPERSTVLNSFKEQASILGEMKILLDALRTEDLENPDTKIVGMLRDFVKEKTTEMESFKTMLNLVN